MIVGWRSGDLPHGSWVCTEALRAPLSPQPPHLRNEQVDSIWSSDWDRGLLSPIAVDQLRDPGQVHLSRPPFLYCKTESHSSAHRMVSREG